MFSSSPYKELRSQNKTEYPKGKKSKITVAQIKVVPIRGDLQENFTKLKTILKEAEKNPEVDVVITSEVFLDGFISLDKEIKKEDMIKYAIDPAKSNYSKYMSNWANRNNKWVICGCMRKAEDGIYNSALIYERDGELVDCYDKLHLQGHDRKYSFGNRLDTYDSDFGTFGIMICADRRWPAFKRKDTRCLSVG